MCTESTLKELAFVCSTVKLCDTAQLDDAAGRGAEKKRFTKKMNILNLNHDIAR